MNIKIYFNFNCLEISDTNSNKPQNQDVRIFEVQKNQKEQLKKIVSDFLDKENSRAFYILCSEAKACFNELKKCFVYIEAAGGFIEKNGSYLFIHRHGRWDLPKGKLEKNETIERCAVRECEEECGVQNLEIIKPLGSSYHIYPYKGDYALKQSYWFYMQTDYNKPLVPQLEEDINEVKWCSKKEIIDTVLPDTYFTITNVVKEALDL